MVAAALRAAPPPPSPLRSRHLPRRRSAAALVAAPSPPSPLALDCRAAVAPPPSPPSRPPLPPHCCIGARPWCRYTRPPSLPCRRHPDATTIAARATAATFAATPPPITARAAMALASALSRPLPVILWPTAVPPPPSSASIPLSPLPPPSSTVPHCHHPRRTTATFAARALGATTVSGVTSSSPSRRSRPACSKPCCGAHGQPRRRTHPPSVATNGSCRT